MFGVLGGGEFSGTRAGTLMEMKIKAGAFGRIDRILAIAEDASDLLENDIGSRGGGIRAVNLGSGLVIVF